MKLSLQEMLSCAWHRTLVVHVVMNNASVAQVLSFQYILKSFMTMFLVVIWYLIIHCSVDRFSFLPCSEVVNFESLRSKLDVQMRTTGLPLSYGLLFPLMASAAGVRWIGYHFIGVIGENIQYSRRKRPRVYDYIICPRFSSSRIKLHNNPTPLADISDYIANCAIHRHI